MHELAELLVNLLVQAMQVFADFGSVPIVDHAFSPWIFLAGLLSLPFAAARQFRARRWLLALVLVLLELYFVHNRLTVFKDLPVTRASLLGNLTLLSLGILFLLPSSIWGGKSRWKP